MGACPAQSWHALSPSPCLPSGCNFGRWQQRTEEPSGEFQGGGEMQGSTGCWRLEAPHAGTGCRWLRLALDHHTHRHICTFALHLTRCSCHAVQGARSPSASALPQTRQPPSRQARSAPSPYARAVRRPPRYVETSSSLRAWGPQLLAPCQPPPPACMHALMRQQGAIRLPCRKLVVCPARHLVVSFAASCPHPERQHHPRCLQLSHGTLPPCPCFARSAPPCPK